MGVTIHYRGTINQLSDIESMENCVLDFAFALGGRASIFRFFAENDPSRAVRGVVAEFTPGQESLSLLISPDGCLTPVFQIDDALQGPFKEPPYCFIKTQFGSLHGHIAVVHLLDALKQRFFHDLSVSDEGHYYHTRDVQQLIQTRRSISQFMDALGRGLEKYGLSDEAMEDVDIVAARIERIAALAQRSVSARQQQDNAEIDSDAEQPDDENEDDEWSEPSLEDEVASMDQLRRRNEQRAERMNRRVAEALASGMSAQQALRLAMQEEGLPVPEDHSSNDWADDSPINSSEDYVSENSDDWQSGIDVSSPAPRHPAMQLADDLFRQVQQLQGTAAAGSPFYGILQRATCDVLGGLAQATFALDSDEPERALAITQLKRAITAHAYASGAQIALTDSQLLNEAQSQNFLELFNSLLTSIHQLTATAWGTAE